MPLAAHCSLIKQAAFLKGVDTLLADCSLIKQAAFLKGVNTLLADICKAFTKGSSKERQQ